MSLSSWISVIRKPAPEAKAIEQDFSKQYDNWQLTTEYTTVAGVKTAIYTDITPSSDETLLFVHGIGGDHHGLIPLAYSLRQHYQIVLVDLPGHGQSDLPPSADLDFIKTWSEQLLDALPFEVTMVIAHSFGCFSSQFMDAPRTCYLNPPLSLTPAVLNYSLKLYSVRHLASLIYHIRPYALWRGQQLVHNLSPETIARIAWVTDSTTISREQFMFQAQLARHTTDGRQLLQHEYMDKNLSFFVLSHFDKIVMTSQSQEEWLVSRPVLRLADDHLSIIESPETIAHTLTKWLRES